MNDKPPNLHHLRVFGFKAFAYVSKNKRQKLDDKSVEGIFDDYDNCSKGHRIYTSGKEIIITSTGKFLENKILYEKIEKPSNKSRKSQYKAL